MGYGIKKGKQSVIHVLKDGTLDDYSALMKISRKK